MRYDRGSAIFPSSHSLWRQLTTKQKSPKVQFLMYKPEDPSSMLHSLWDDPYAKKIPPDSLLRTSDQHSFMAKVVNDVADGVVEIIDFAASQKEREAIGVITTPEFSLALGIPINEAELEVIIGKLMEYLKESGNFLHIHLASFLVHLSGASKFFDRLPRPKIEGPEILNVALIGKVDGDGCPTINVYYKQYVSNNDPFAAYNSKREPDNPQEINLNRVVFSEQTKAVFVGELCLENVNGVGLVAVAQAIGRKLVSGSVDYMDYQGYHLLSSDTINYIAMHSAFKIFAQNDARNGPAVSIIGDDDKPIRLQVKSTVTMNSDKLIARGNISVFPAIELQAMRPILKELVAEIIEENSLESSINAFKK
jgi:uncharacterized protein YaiE (UPF0345 family)